MVADHNMMDTDSTSITTSPQHIISMCMYCMDIVRTDHE